MKDIDLVKLKELAKEALNDEWIDVYELAGLSLALIEQLEAAQRELDSVTDQFAINLVRERSRRENAEAELKRRDAQEPVAWMLYDPEFKLSVPTKAEYTLNFYKSKGWEVSPLYAAAPAVVLPPEMKLSDVYALEFAVDDPSEFLAGANYMRRLAIELGCQPEKVMKLPARMELVGDVDGNCILNDAKMVLDPKGHYVEAWEVIKALNADNIKWEESK